MHMQFKNMYLMVGFYYMLSISPQSNVSSMRAATTSIDSS